MAGHEITMAGGERYVDVRFTTEELALVLDALDSHIEYLRDTELGRNQYAEFIQPIDDETTALKADLVLGLPKDWGCRRREGQR